MRQPLRIPNAAAIHPRSPTRSATKQHRPNHDPHDQITLDLNPRWGTNGDCTTDPGPGPTIRLQARETGPGGYTQGGFGFVAYRTNTAQTWPAYLSHVAINLLTHDLAGQSVEAYDYHIGPAGGYVESAPWELADFDFPSRHGLGGTYYDHAGRPAYDLLHKLPYP